MIRRLSGLAALAIQRGVAAWVMAVTLLTTSEVVAEVSRNEEVSALFSQATEKINSEKYDEAVSLLQTIADGPHDLADDALFLMAEIVETHKADPEGASRLYSRLLSEHSQSRLARSAQRRLQEIHSAAPRGQDALFLGEFTKTTQSYSQRHPQPSIERALKLLREARDWTGRDRVHRWLGQIYQRQGDHVRALQQFLLASHVHPGSALAFETRLSAADTASLLGRQREALVYLDGLVPLDPGQDIAIADTRNRIVTADRRRQWEYFCFAAIVAAGVFFLVSARLAVGSFRALWVELRRPPMAFWFMLPMAFVIGGMAITGQADTARAVLWILFGGLVTTYASSVGLAHSRAGITIVAHAVVSAVAIAAVFYLVVVRSGLIDLLIATVRFGPDV